MTDFNNNLNKEYILEYIKSKAKKLGDGVVSFTLEELNISNIGEILSSLEKDGKIERIVTCTDKNNQFFVKLLEED